MIADMLSNKKLNPILTELFKIGSHCGDHICQSSIKVRRQSIPTNCTYSKQNSSPFIKWVFFKLSTLFCFYKKPVYKLLALGT